MKKRSHAHMLNSLLSTKDVCSKDKIEDLSNRDNIKYSEDNLTRVYNIIENLFSKNNIPPIHNGVLDKNFLIYIPKGVYKSDCGSSRTYSIKHDLLEKRIIYEPTIEILELSSNNCHFYIKAKVPQNLCVSSGERGHDFQKIQVESSKIIVDLNQQTITDTNIQWNLIVINNTDYTTYYIPIKIMNTPLNTAYSSFL